MLQLCIINRLIFWKDSVFFIILEYYIADVIIQKRLNVYDGALYTFSRFCNKTNDIGAFDSVQSPLEFILSIILAVIDRKKSTLIFNLILISPHNFRHSHSVIVW